MDELTPEIVLSDSKDTLRGYGGDFKEQDRLSYVAGIHSCGDLLLLHSLSLSHNVLACKRCCFRLPIAREVKTYQDLKNLLVKYNKDKQ